MEIYGGDNAEIIFKSLNIPINSLGVFKANDNEWVYWFSDGKIYDTGSAITEAEAKQKAKAHIVGIGITYMKMLFVHLKVQ